MLNAVPSVTAQQKAHGQDGWGGRLGGDSLINVLFKSYTLNPGKSVSDLLLLIVVCSSSLLFVSPIRKSFERETMRPHGLLFSASAQKVVLLYFPR